MVDCPHINHSVCIAQLDLEQLKRLSSKHVLRDGKDYGGPDRGYSRPNGPFFGRRNKNLILTDGENNWNCVECGTSQCPWLCLSCGLIHCGRYVNQDGLKHYQTYPNHSVCMDCYEYSVYCYQCDDFVGNDTDDSKISSVRSSLQFYNRLRYDDHTYSSSKYGTASETEDVVEISADESLPPFYDEGTEEEVDGSIMRNDSNPLLYSPVMESPDLRFSVPAEDSSLKKYRSGRVEFSLSNNDEQTEKEESDSMLSSDDRRATLRSSLSPGNDFAAKNASIPPPPSLHVSSSFESSLRKRKREPSGSFDIETKVPSPESQPSVAGASGHPIIGVSASTPRFEENERKLRGLRNLGNTCFMNSVLQALGCIEIFRYFMKNLPPVDFYTYMSDPVSTQSPRYNTRNSSTSALSEAGVQPTFVSEELRKTLIEIGNVSITLGSAINAFGPVAFLEEVRKFAPRFRGFQQHDAHEFLRCILDRMQIELKSYRFPDWLLSEVCEGGVQIPSGSHFTTQKHEHREVKDERKCPIAAMFEGTLQSQVTCLACSTISNKQDPFLDLSLDILCPLTNSRTAAVHLTDCLQRFFAKEELDSCEQYMCTKCSGKRPSTKQLFIKMLPNVLCLHLKRFRWSSFHRGKLDNMVEFPLKGLDMKPFMVTPSTTLTPEGKVESVPLNPDSRSNSYSSCSSLSASAEDNSMLYDLTSLVVHHGGGINCGHYTAFGQRNEIWYNFNDSCVKECPADLVTKQKAYILFYTRRTH